MINLKNINKKNIIVVFALSLICIGIGSTMAYLSDADKVENSFKIGTNKIEIVEDFEPPAKLEPNIEFKKDVSIKNVGSGDTFVRIKAVFTDSDMEKYCTVDFNSSEDKNDKSVDYWYNTEDGYYYYKENLKIGDSSPSLFTKVALGNIPVEEIKDFDILVYVESYQSAGFDNYNDAWDYYQRNNPSNQ